MTIDSQEFRNQRWRLWRDGIAAILPRALREDNRPLLETANDLPTLAVDSITAVAASYRILTPKAFNGFLCVAQVAVISTCFGIAAALSAAPLPLLLAGGTMMVTLSLRDTYVHRSWDFDDKMPRLHRVYVDILGDGLRHGCIVGDGSPCGSTFAVYGARNLGSFPRLRRRDGDDRCAPS